MTSKIIDNFVRDRFDLKYLIKSGASGQSFLRENAFNLALAKIFQLLIQYDKK
jgi:hypothetical protein